MEFSGLGILLSHIRELFMEWEELPAVVRWLSTGIIILFIEYQFPTLLIIWFALAAFITALVALFLPDFELLHMSLFVIFSFIFLSYRRELIALLTPADVLGFFTHELIGRKATCSKNIEVKKTDGLVMVGGVDWSALSLDSDISKDEKVLVVGRKDHTLFVEPYDHDLAQKVKKHRHMIKKSFPVSISSDKKKNIIIDGRNFAAKTIAKGRELMNGELVEIVAIGKKDVIVDLKDKDFLLPRDLIGKTGTASESFGDSDKKLGSVKIDGVIWTAESLASLKINNGEQIVVTGIDGITLCVEAIKKTASLIS